ncbi:hypothetical protein GCM10022419_041320 [Nonomuraea rosea]|uniref:Uncharacterized protein n=1 Tax=Nonomuraea rosea TaxID=638574 RepID=A0ABP6WUH0_9ACTN
MSAAAVRSASGLDMLSTTSVGTVTAAYRVRAAELASVVSYTRVGAIASSAARNGEVRMPATISGGMPIAVWNASTAAPPLAGPHQLVELLDQIGGRGVPYGRRLEQRQLHGPPGPLLAQARLKGQDRAGGVAEHERRATRVVDQRGEIRSLPLNTARTDTVRVGAWLFLPGAPDVAPTNGTAPDRQPPG